MINFILATLSLFYINAPFAVMREHPKNDAEVVSQVYYSEEVNVIEEAQDWMKIENIVDHYQGWVPKNTLHERQEVYPATNSSAVAKVNRNSVHVYHVEDTIYGPIITLPYESKLQVQDYNPQSNSRWLKVTLVDDRQGYIQRGDITFNHAPLNREQMCALSLKFLDLPYTWGGRSSFGYDCSGYVQMLYRQMGIAIPRDSKHQINWEGFTTTTFDALTPGDLIFFGLAENKIRHVGLYLGNNQFIHSTVAENTPYIRISLLTDPEWNGSGRFVFRAARTLKEAKNG